MDATTFAAFRIRRIDWQYDLRSYMTQIVVKIKYIINMVIFSTIPNAMFCIPSPVQPIEGILL